MTAAVVAGGAAVRVPATPAAEPTLTRIRPLNCLLAAQKTKMTMLTQRMVVAALASGCACVSAAPTDW